MGVKGLMETFLSEPTIMDKFLWDTCVYFSPMHIFELQMPPTSPLINGGTRLFGA